ncbi:MAG: hypothetical protein QOJ76_3596 [Acidobacteriota bacterium]|jgi:hypothetical protein|nr:hypothetical protein [Acidobacteriota bacterium]
MWVFAGDFGWLWVVSGLLQVGDTLLQGVIPLLQRVL